MGVPVKINRAGLSDREFTLEKPAETFRILVLGDSITFGWGVEQDKTFCKLLEKKLNGDPPPGGPPHYEVINTGVGNYNTSQEVAYFLERGRLYKPDMVLLAFFINDAEPTPREERNWLARTSCLYVFASSFWDGILRDLKLRASYKDYYRSLYTDGKPGWVACRAGAEGADRHLSRRTYRLADRACPGVAFRRKGLRIQGRVRESQSPGGAWQCSRDRSSEWS